MVRTAIAATALSLAASAPADVIITGILDGTIALSGVYTDEFVYIVNSSSASIAAFESIFGTTGDFANVITSGLVTGTGNDRFSLVAAGGDLSGTLDAIGNPGGSNIYQDSFLYRLDGTGPDGGFVEDNFFGPGNNALDGLTDTEIGAAVPFGTYQIPTPASAGLLALAGLTATRRRRA